jgi:hypothetical protein
MKIRNYPFLTHSRSYQAINILTGSLIIFVLLYSAFHSVDDMDHPVECVHVAVYGEECSTCGLSRSFSMMARGNISSATEYNRNGPLLFAFFGSQLFLRALAGGLIFVAGRQRSFLPLPVLARTDAAVSVILFLVCFRFLLVFW